MTGEELKQLQFEFESKHGPLLAAVAEAMGGMIRRRDMVSLAMFNEALRSLGIHAAEELRQCGREQPAGPGAGARLIPGAKRYFFDN